MFRLSATKEPITNVPNKMRVNIYADIDQYDCIGWNFYIRGVRVESHWNPFHFIMNTGKYQHKATYQFVADIDRPGNRIPNRAIDDPANNFIPEDLEEIVGINYRVKILGLIVINDPLYIEIASGTLKLQPRFAMHGEPFNVTGLAYSNYDPSVFMPEEEIPEEVIISDDEESEIEYDPNSKIWIKKNMTRPETTKEIPTLGSINIKPVKPV